MENNKIVDGPGTSLFLCVYFSRMQQFSSNVDVLGAAWRDYLSDPELKKIQIEKASHHP